jgi:superfamily II DNA helicase RecQ
VAFGLGVDLPNVTLVVHWDVPTSVQMYVQQIGKAGRRGDACLCLTLLDEEHLEKFIKRACHHCDDKERRKQVVSEAKEVGRLTARQFLGNDVLRQDRVSVDVDHPV